MMNELGRHNIIYAAIYYNNIELFKALLEANITAPKSMYIILRFGSLDMLKLYEAYGNDVIHCPNYNYFGKLYIWSIGIIGASQIDAREKYLYILKKMNGPKYDIIAILHELTTYGVYRNGSADLINILLSVKFLSELDYEAIVSRDEGHLAAEIASIDINTGFDLIMLSCRRGVSSVMNAIINRVHKSITPEMLCKILELVFITGNTGAFIKLQKQFRQNVLYEAAIIKSRPVTLFDEVHTRCPSLMPQNLDMPRLTYIAAYYGRVEMLKYLRDIRSVPEQEVKGAIDGYSINLLKDLMTSHGELIKKEVSLLTNTGLQTDIRTAIRI
jgi:hypothetical protein